MAGGLADRPQYLLTYPTCPFCGQTDNWDGSGISHNSDCPTQQKEEKAMSGITNWCSQGAFKILVAGKEVTVKGHPFDADDPESEIVGRTKKIKDENGVTRNIAYEAHMCGPCMRANDPFHEYEEQDKVKQLEAWNDGWNAAKAGEDKNGPSGSDS